jgi:acetylornithine/succinyldiaminopimelate/putrescine aminotransferase
MYPNRGLGLVRGEGSYLIARDGTRYLDLMTNYGAAMFGHGHPVIVAALQEQIARLATLHGSFGSDVRARASVAVGERVPVPGASFAWTNSGTEAVEAALKFAAAATGRSRIVAFQGGYHGKTLGALSVTDGARYHAALGGLLVRQPLVPYGDPDAVGQAIDGDTAAVIVEPIQGESGVRVPPEGFLPAVRRLCTERRVLLIADEIQTGGGRTGWFTECERQGVEPDLLCLGKGLAGGFPVGIVAVAPAVAERLPRGLHTSTFGGNPVAAAGVLAALTLLTPDRLAQVTVLGQRLRSALEGRLGIPPTRGKGLMLGVEILGGRRDAFLKALQRERVLAIPAGDDAIRFLPSITIVAEDLMEGAAAFHRIRE